MSGRQPAHVIGQQSAKRKRHTNPVDTATSSTARIWGLAELHDHGVPNGHVDEEGFQLHAANHNSKPKFAASWPLSTPTPTPSSIPSETSSSPGSKSDVRLVAPVQNIAHHPYHGARSQQTGKVDHFCVQPVQYRRSGPVNQSPSPDLDVVHMARYPRRHISPSQSGLPGGFYGVDSHNRSNLISENQIGNSNRSQAQPLDLLPATAGSEFSYAWSQQPTEGNAMNQNHLSGGLAFSSSIDIAGLVGQSHILSSTNMDEDQSSNGVSTSLPPQTSADMFPSHAYQYHQQHAPQQSHEQHEQQQSCLAGPISAFPTQPGPSQASTGEYLTSLASHARENHWQQDTSIQRTPVPYIHNAMGGGDFHPNLSVSDNDGCPPAVRQTQGVLFSHSVYTGPASTENGPSPTSYDNASSSHGQGSDHVQGHQVQSASQACDNVHADVVLQSRILYSNRNTASQELKHESTDDDDIVHITSAYAREAEDDATERPGKRSRSAKARGAFDDQKRKATADTRKRKACLRCRAQKTRCDVHPGEPDGPCMTCENFSKTSKKTIHFVPCFRGKLTDAILFRQGGLNLTSRWTGTDIKDVTDRINPSDIRTIFITLDACDVPMVVKVVKFKKRSDDATARFWTVQDNGRDVRKKKELATYCLHDIQATAKYFEKYIIDNAISSLWKQRMPPVKLANMPAALLGPIEQTYLKAMQHYHDLEDNIGTADNPEKRLMRNLFILWFAMRHTTGMSYICGTETLDMKPEYQDDTYPLFGKVSVPRMILAQFDSINYTRILTVYSKKVLQDLELLIHRLQSRHWWTIYLCMFILLREASWITEDRYRHARDNHGKKIRYSIPAFVEELQASCNNLLHHWHYYNSKPWPDANAPAQRHKSLLAELSSENYQLVMDTMTHPRVQAQLNMWKCYRSDNGFVEQLERPRPQAHQTEYTGSQAALDWDHPFYWISQLFDDSKDWAPHPTYQREYDD